MANLFPASFSFVNTASPFVANNIFWNNPCRAIDITIPQDNSPVIINNPSSAI